MILTPDQQTVFEAILAFAKSPDKTHITVGGYAGTGKTTVVAHTVHTLRSMGINNIGFCCYTGKASSVLRGKLIASNALKSSYCGTIHSLIYDVVTDKNGRVIGFDRKPAIEERILVLDEASMADDVIWKDLLSYKVPIIAVGDHGQLPPIQGTFNLMENPMYRLEKIHRQAEDNPIIKLATKARLDGEIPFGKHGPGVYRGNMTDDRVMESAVQWGTLRTTLYLCGFNKTRVRINKRVREALGYGGDPQPGEKVICLKNNHDAHIFNGVTGIVQSCRRANNLFYVLRAKMENGVVFEGPALIEQFNAVETVKTHPKLQPCELKELFDFGYCLTVHKAQGSEADTVTLFEERAQKWTDEYWRRWLYTGVTRAKKYLTIVNRRWAPKPSSFTAA